ncbi:MULTISPECIES: aldehyde reductase [unclassified Sphingopyxis]|uniref:SDR family oxidoreductase n=1 Tax=unclassified Sphingopyxis TaxID=2614943 RepID=UPI000731C107|nr:MULTISPECIES: aldehyde reductase [unclassified Sphingopyxis]KTE25382.1 epimerase [Sphingopyxis sp. H057]KTE53403.1 epimerase [Sphingopyxis sp. H073]KTE55993.1 epimerase [Sphingopyxis sp. H071]KTE60919.1 epimerase [Sphingopyxis sp. H100]KTE62892.1 epimerase [Sphingopyxis sp. H107]
MTGTVLVTGGSGYIAGFLIRQLIENGWTVNTTVRSLKREDEVRGWLQVDNSKLRFFAADLENDAGWAEAMAGCSHVAHLASPFPLDVPKHADDLVVPAREGALRALRFAKGAGVRRFVLTSSMAAIAYGHGQDRELYDESDWTNLDNPGVMPYPRSKTVAERAARDWVAAEGGDLEFASVNPAAVFGPLLSDDLSTSIELVKQLLEGKVPMCPDIGFGIIDVRDVADLHYRALTAPDIRNERYVCSGPFLKMIDVANILTANLGDKARKVPTRKMPDWLLKLFALVRPELKQLVAELGNVRGGDSRHAMDTLGWTVRPPEEAILATAHSLIERGIVKV